MFSPAIMVGLVRRVGTVLDYGLAGAPVPLATPVEEAMYG